MICLRSGHLPVILENDHVSLMLLVQACQITCCAETTMAWRVYGLRYKVLVQEVSTSQTKCLAGSLGWGVGRTPSALIRAASLARSGM